MSLTVLASLFGGEIEGDLIAFDEQEGGNPVALQQPPEGLRVALHPVCAADEQNGLRLGKQRLRAQLAEIPAILAAKSRYFWCIDNQEFDMMPDVFSLETGAPFTPFSRTPQIRYDYETKNVKLTATALYQFQYTSYGPNGASFDYARNAIIPEMYFQGIIKSGDFMMGLGVDVLTLKPRTQYNVTEKTIVNTPVVDANGNPTYDLDFSNIGSGRQEIKYVGILGY